jgi:fatty acid desaturase
MKTTQSDIGTTPNLSVKTPNNVKAFTMLVVPAFFAICAVFFSCFVLSMFTVGVLFYSFFFTQTFILLHECGHLNFFKGKRLNYFGGYFFGFLSGIPFLSWMHMHNLHHRWTGWRDKDPTTERTVGPPSVKILQWVVNFCWLLFIPLFYLVYMFSNYWNIFKIRRFLRVDLVRQISWEMMIYMLGYALVLCLVPSRILIPMFFGFLLSLVWKELIILTQHTHIEIPTSQGKSVRPISYADQIQYTRSFHVGGFFEKWFLFNFNLHEAHHAQPGIPAYFLSEIDLKLPNKPSYWNWFKNAKGMWGVDFIFKTSKHTGNQF